jgi:hypothetical protein
VTAGQKIILCLGVLSFATSMAGASAMNIARDTERADPFSGLRWQRVMNPDRPAAPPRLTRMRGADAAGHADKRTQRPTVCVRAGDRVALRSANAGSSAFSLEAMALENGACGERVRARVAVTGAVVEMRVLDSRTAVFSREAAAWR